MDVAPIHPKSIRCGVKQDHHYSLAFAIVPDTDNLYDFFVYLSVCFSLLPQHLHSAPCEKHKNKLQTSSVYRSTSKMPYESTITFTLDTICPWYVSHARHSPCFALAFHVPSLFPKKTSPAQHSTTVHQKKRPLNSAKPTPVPISHHLTPTTGPTSPSSACAPPSPNSPTPP